MAISNLLAGLPELVGDPSKILKDNIRMTVGMCLLGCQQKMKIVHKDVDYLGNMMICA